MHVRRLVLAVAGAATVTLAVAAAAWACTAQPTVISPGNGPPGSLATMKGQATAGSTVEVRWNAIDGQMLGLGTADANNNFSVPVQVPEVAPGINYMTAVVVDDGNRSGVARMVFEVLPSPNAGPQLAGSPSGGLSDLWGSRASGVTSAGGSGAGMAVGIGLLAVGTLGLTAGTGFVAIRSRRARTSS